MYESSSSTPCSNLYDVSTEKFPWPHPRSPATVKRDPPTTEPLPVRKRTHAGLLLKTPSSTLLGFAIMENGCDGFISGTRTLECFSSYDAAAQHQKQTNKQTNPRCLFFFVFSSPSRSLNASQACHRGAAEGGGVGDQPAAGGLRGVPSRRAGVSGDGPDQGAKWAGEALR